MTRPVAYRGARLTVAYAVCADGSSPACEFVSGLGSSDRAKIEHLFRIMGETGKIANREKFRKLSGNSFEFKSFQIRLPCYFDGAGDVVVTHGFVKKKDASAPEEIARAERIRKEDLER